MAVFGASTQTLTQDDAPNTLAQPLQDPLTLLTVHNHKNKVSNAPPPLPPQQVAPPFLQQPTHEHIMK